MKIELSKVTEREIDALVAEKVMGWGRPTECARTPAHKWQNPEDGCCYDDCPNFSTDHNDAAKVLAVFTEWVSYKHQDGTYSISLRLGEDEFGSCDGAKSPTMCIAIAALRAKGVEVVE